MAEQLAFDLPVREALGRDAFMVAPANSLALAMVDSWRDWPQGKLVLTGPPGAGKSHLARVWATESNAQVISATELAGVDVGTLPAGAAFAIDDADRVTGPTEAAFLHLHNAVLASGGRLLMTAATPPRDWPLVLPDLVSRVQAAAVAQIDLPDDALLAAVLVKQFADRQIAVTPALIGYVVGRMERTLGAARAIVAALDARALARGRPVGREIAAEVLDELASDR